MKTLIFYTFVVFVQFIICPHLDTNNEFGIDLKCNNTELEKAGDNYNEKCIQENTKLYAELNDKDTEIEPESICQFLEQFIHNCTTDHLGNCYPEEHICAIMQEQKIIAR